MAPFCVAGIILVCVFAAARAAEELCTNEWDISVAGVPDSELTVHHSSTLMPGFTHLVWHWRVSGKPSATMWLSQRRQKDKFSGGFVAQPMMLKHLPSSFHWRLANGSLHLSSHGDLQELADYPAWSVSACNGLIVWGVSENKDVYVTYDEINQTRSLDEAVGESLKMNKRQAEFPTEPDQPDPSSKPPSTNSFSAWWRRFLQSIGIGNSQGERGDKPRSWMMDLTEMLLKLMFSGITGRPMTRSNPNIPKNPDAEEILPGYRDIESLTEAPFSEGRNPKRVQQAPA